jgi:hypothetical protein
MALIRFPQRSRGTRSRGLHPANTEAARGLSETRAGKRKLRLLAYNHAKRLKLENKLHEDCLADET